MTVLVGLGVVGMALSLGGIWLPRCLIVVVG